MVEDIDFKKAMLGVRRLKSETASPPARSRNCSDRVLRKEIQERASRSTHHQIEPILETKESGSGQSNEIGSNTLFFVRHGLQKKVLRDLKKGSRYPIEHVLDLHGLTKNKAHQAITQTILHYQGTGTHCLLIIHGKGLRSEQTATLKHFTADFLKTLAPVKAYCAAQIQDGGTGALYVLIK